MRRVLTAVSTGLCFGCALLARAGEPHHSIDVSRAFDAGGGSSAPPAGSLDRTPPDPLPWVERRQWLFDLRWDRGDLRLASVRRLDLAGPQSTPRVMGRFALELFEGAALLERVRFDFPLLAVPDASGPGAPAFSAKLRTRVQVLFPAIARGTRFELVDRSSRRRWSLPWPPEDPGADAGR